ncbi:MAG TPA: NUDIX domain-containing protein [Bauldia sp.]|jgi:nudix-type nucleoside diphosphatase (YffH/AdpP family)
MSGEERVRIVRETLLADDWARLTKYSIELKRRDGVWEPQIRQVYDRGNGAAILPIDPKRGTVLLVRQFRMPVYINAGPGAAERGMLIEACAGLLDKNDPETAIRKEAEEELGYRLRAVQRVFDTYMSPGSVSERLSLFVADYSPADRISAGGGEADEGEDIEVLELTLAEALAMVERGEIADGKTIILLQYAKLKGLGHD